MSDISENLVQSVIQEVEQDNAAEDIVENVLNDLIRNVAQEELRNYQINWELENFIIDKQLVAGR